MSNMRLLVAGKALGEEQGRRGKAENGVRDRGRGMAASLNRPGLGLRGLARDVHPHLLPGPPVRDVNVRTETSWPSAPDQGRHEVEFDLQRACIFSRPCVDI
jgi:hypothetical protein